MIRRGYFLYLQNVHNIIVPDERMLKRVGRSDMVEIAYADNEKPIDDAPWEGIEEEEWK